MALEKVIEIDRIEVVGEHKVVQVRKATIIREDGIELSRSFQRHAIAPDISADDLAKEDAQVQAICNTMHTTAVKAAYAKHLKEMLPE